MSEDAEDRGYRRGRADAGLITAAAEDQITALQADVARLEGERDEARARATEAARHESEALDRCDAMRSVVEGVESLVATFDGAAAWNGGGLFAGLANLMRDYAAVSTQDAPSRPMGTPQSDVEGSGVAQDVQEALGAQKGAQGASEAAYEAGVAEGRRQAVEAIRARVGAIAAVEWAALIVEEEGR